MQCRLSRIHAMDAGALRGLEARAAAARAGRNPYADFRFAQAHADGPTGQPPG